MKNRVGILGATGAVGQRFVQLLRGHPWFDVVALYASSRSAGKPYHEAVNWRVPVLRPTYLDDLVVQTMDPHDGVDLVFSALPSDTAQEVEPRFAAAGIPVISNAGAFRMAPDVPLLIPEVNPGHSALIDIQRKKRGWDGFIITNPNCSAIGLVLPLAPIHRAFGISKIIVTTMQARSGAGYPGPPDEVINDNVLPHISGEEDKLESEPQKILGTFKDSGIEHAPIDIAAQCNRVNVVDGHLESVSLTLDASPTVDDIKAVLTNFSGVPQEAGLPFAPAQVIQVFDDADRPQPKLDRDLGHGMTVSVGKIRPCPVLDIRFTCLSHNTIRGAAGAAILNAELLRHQGYIPDEG